MCVWLWGVGYRIERSVSCQIHIWYLVLRYLRTVRLPTHLFSVLFSVLFVFVVRSRIHTVLLIVQFPRDAGIRDANLGS